jgi:hypothetical protein
MTVYADYQELQMANSMRGLSHIILFGKKDSFFYRLDMPFELLSRANGDSLISCKNGITNVFKFTDPNRLICTAGGCFEGSKGVAYVYK